MSNWLEGGLSYIAQQQHDDGSFDTWFSFDATELSQPRFAKTTFVPSLIGQFLHEIPSVNAGRVGSKIARYLREQSSSKGTFNYWDKRSPFRQSTPYPDDLDDTCCALAALALHDPANMSGNVLALAGQALINGESKPGGPYRTWLVGQNAAPIWLDVDPIVNANIAFFLESQHIKLTNLKRYLSEMVIKSAYHSPYYKDSCAEAYFLARVCLSTAAQTRLVASLLAEQNNLGHWGSAQRTAFAMSALLALGQSSESLGAAARYIQRQQQPDGSWPPAALFVNTAKRPATEYAGSPVITTAICLSALSVWQRAQELPLKPIKSVQNIPGRLARQEVRHHIAEVSASTDLWLNLHRMYRRSVRHDRDGQISGMPWYAAQAIGTRLSNTVLQQLGAANIWGWMAYTAYDDIMDYESASVARLPAANFALRTFTKTVALAVPHETFKAEVASTMQRLDAAHAWELGNCRLPIKDATIRLAHLPSYGNYEELANRSLGHSLPALGVVYESNSAQQEAQLTAFRSFFQHYIIARQLNDDAHDWEEDLLTGYVNAAAVPLVQLWRQGQTAQNSKHLNIAEERHALRRIMWEVVMPDICTQIADHISQAEQALHVPEIMYAERFLSFTRRVQAAADKAMTKREETLAFIKNF